MAAEPQLDEEPYIILSSVAPDSLSKQVQLAMLEGYTPLGAPFIDQRGTWYQAMMLDVLTW